MKGWQTFKLKELADITRGGSPRPIDEYITKGEGYNWLRIGDVPKDGKFITKVSAKIKAEGLTKTTLVHDGDFILSNSMSFGRPYIMKIDSCIHDGWLALRNLNKELIDRNFLYYLLLLPRTQYIFSAFSAGSGVQNLKKETVKEIEVIVPTIDEQKRIVAILETWDEYRESLNRAIILKKNLKKSVIQKLINQQVRFKDQNGKHFPPWQVKKLGEIAEFTNGKPFEDAIDDNGKFSLITIDSIGIDGHLKSNHRKVNRTDNSLKKGDLVIVLSDIAHGYLLGLSDVIPEDGKYVLNQRMGRLRIQANCDPEFLRTWINANQIHFRKRAQGTSQRHIYERDVLELELAIPGIDEQQQIAEFVTKIDNDISMLEKKRHIISDQKTYLANKLVAGNIRSSEELKSTVLENNYA
jgi:type I restriction enzyme S subunit